MESIKASDMQPSSQESRVLALHFGSLEDEVGVVPQVLAYAAARPTVKILTEDAEHSPTSRLYHIPSDIVTKVAKHSRPVFMKKRSARLQTTFPVDAMDVQKAST